MIDPMKFISGVKPDGAAIRHALTLANEISPDGIDIDRLRQVAEAGDLAAADAYISEIVAASFPDTSRSVAARQILMQVQYGIAVRLVRVTPEGVDAIAHVGRVGASRLP